MRKLLLPILLLFLFVTGQAQTSQPRDLGDGYKVQMSIVKEKHFALISFPEEKLKSLDSFKEAVSESLIKVFTCEAFVDCKPARSPELYILKGFEEFGPFFAVDTKTERIAVFPLWADDDSRIIGISITLVNKEDATVMPEGKSY